MGIFDKGEDEGEGGEVVDATQRIAERIADEAGDLPALPDDPPAEAVLPTGDVEVLVVTAHNGIAKGTRLWVTPERAESLVGAQLAVRVVEGG